MNTRAINPLLMENNSTAEYLQVLPHVGTLMNHLSL
jgi:hypothetical protein